MFIHLSSGQTHTVVSMSNSFKTSKTVDKIPTAFAHALPYSLDQINRYQRHCTTQDDRQKTLIVFFLGIIL